MGLVNARNLRLAKQLLERNRHRVGDVVEKAGEKLDQVSEGRTASVTSKATDAAKRYSAGAPGAPGGPTEVTARRVDRDGHVIDPDAPHGRDRADPPDRPRRAASPDEGPGRRRDRRDADPRGGDPRDGERPGGDRRDGPGTGTGSSAAGAVQAAADALGGWLDRQARAAQERDRGRDDGRGGSVRR